MLANCELLSMASGRSNELVFIWWASTDQDN